MLTANWDKKKRFVPSLREALLKAGYSDADMQRIVQNKMPGDAITFPVPKPVSPRCWNG